MKRNKKNWSDIKKVLTSWVSKDAGVCQWIGLSFFQSLRQTMNLNCPAGADERFLHRFLLVPVLSKSLLPLPPLQDDVNVAGNEGADMLALSCLHTVVLVLVVSKVEGEPVGGGGPSLDSGQRPSLQDLLCLLVQPEHRVLCHPQKTRYKFVSTFLLLLKMLNCICWWNLNPGRKGEIRVYSE